MHLRYTAWLVLMLMTATLAGCNKITAPNQVISETGPVAQSGSVAQSAAIAQSSVVIQSGAITQSGPIAQSEAPLAPDPSYPDLIADRLKSTFKDYASYKTIRNIGPALDTLVSGLELAGLGPLSGSRSQAKLCANFQQR